MKSLANKIVIRSHGLQLTIGEGVGLYGILII